MKAHNNINIATNLMYSLAIIVEGLALDLNHPAYNPAVNMRRFIHITKPRISEPAGQAADFLETQVFHIADKQNLLSALVEIMWELHKTIIRVNRKSDPDFMYIHSPEILKMKHVTAGTRPAIVKRVAKELDKCTHI